MRLTPEVSCAECQRERCELQGETEGDTVPYWQDVECARDDRAGQLTNGESRGHQTEKRGRVTRRPRPGLLYSDHRYDHEGAADQQCRDRNRDRCEPHAGERTTPAAWRSILADGPDAQGG